MTGKPSRDHVETCFRGRGTYKNILDMFSFHFVKIDFRKFFGGSGFCVLPFLGLANTTQRHTSNTACRRKCVFFVVFNSCRRCTYANQLQTLHKNTWQHVGVHGWCPERVSSDLPSVLDFWYFSPKNAPRSQYRYRACLSPSGTENRLSVD